MRGHACFRSGRRCGRGGRGGWAGLAGLNTLLGCSCTDGIVQGAPVGWLQVLERLVVRERRGVLELSDGSGRLSGLGKGQHRGTGTDTCDPQQSGFLHGWNTSDGPSGTLGNASHAGRASPCQPAGAGWAGSEGSGRAVLAFRLKVGGRRVERGEHDRSNRHGIRCRRQFRHHRCCVTSAGADVAAVTLRIAVRAAGVLVCMPLAGMRGASVSMVVPVHAMVRVAHSRGELTRLTRFCAKHGRSHRTPEREQHANQQQNEDAKKSHGQKTSRRWSSPFVKKH